MVLRSKYRKSRRPRPAYAVRVRRRFRRAARRATYRRSTNTVSRLKMNAPLTSRTLQVKLPWCRTFTPLVEEAGKFTVAFQGNAIVPWAFAAQSGANTSITNGDTIAAGAVEYSNFYDRYFVTGSSINIEILNSNAATYANVPGTFETSGYQGVCRAVLLAVPFVGVDSTGAPDDTWQNVKAQLDSYEYSQLLQWPGARYRMVGANTGGASHVNLKLYRKTRSVCGVKDLKDNATQYSGALTDGVTDWTPRINPTDGFMYYLALFNQSAEMIQPVFLTVKMMLYTTMVSREFITTRAITNTPP